MLSTTQLRDRIWREYSVRISAPLVRRAIDLLEFAERIEVQKIGKYRLIRPCDVPQIIGELQREGLLPVLPTQEATPC